MLPAVFYKVHPRFRTPHVSTILTGVFVAVFAAVASIDEMVDLTNIGTLFAFILVCAGVWLMRRRRPDLERGFTVPVISFVAPAGIIVCGAMIYGLGWTNWLRLGAWLAVGMFLYFGYGKKHSKLATA